MMKQSNSENKPRDLSLTTPNIAYKLAQIKTNYATSILPALKPINLTTRVMNNAVAGGYEV